MINVTAAIIERNGNILIAKRSSTSSLPNKWEFPGGKIEVGETPEECLARELYEEFDIMVTVGDFIAESVYQYERKTVRLLGFMVQYDGEIKVMNAHDDVKWVPVDDLLDYDLAPADVPIAREVQKREW
jgi:8-oxo-dGTP diphosphatase